MKRFMLAVVAFAIVGGTAGAMADPTRVSDPTGNFTDTEGNAGYVEVDDSGAVRACNENDATPLGDDGTGYAWVNIRGEDTVPTYGNETVGAGDEDGADGSSPDDGDGDTNDDCPPGDEGPE